MIIKGELREFRCREMRKEWNKRRMVRVGKMRGAKWRKEGEKREKVEKEKKRKGN